MDTLLDVAPIPCYVKSQRMDRIFWQLVVTLDNKWNSNVISSTCANLLETMNAGRPQRYIDPCSSHCAYTSVIPVNGHHTASFHRRLFRSALSSFCSHWQSPVTYHWSDLLHFFIAQTRPLLHQ